MRSRIIQTSVVAVGAFGLVFGLAACGSSNSSGQPSQTTTSQATSNSDPVQAGGLSSHTLPQGWPSDVPSPANTQVEGGAVINGGASAAFKGSGDMNAAVDAYSAQLKAAGWTVDKSADFGAKGLSHWKKGTRGLTVITVQEADGTFAISVTEVNKQS